MCLAMASNLHEWSPCTMTNKSVSDPAFSRCENGKAGSRTNTIDATKQAAGRPECTILVRCSSKTSCQNAALAAFLHEDRGWGQQLQRAPAGHPFGAAPDECKSALCSLVRASLSPFSVVSKDQTIGQQQQRKWGQGQGLKQRTCNWLRPLFTLYGLVPLLPGGYTHTYHRTLHSWPSRICRHCVSCSHTPVILADPRCPVRRQLLYCPPLPVGMVAQPLQDFLCCFLTRTGQ